MKKINIKNSYEPEVLKSGAELYKIKDDSIPIIYFKLIIENGALSESKDEKGITSILSRMLTIGNKSFPQSEIDACLDSLSASLNISSNYDFFAIISRMPALNFGKFIDFLDKLLFSKNDFDNEKFEISKSKAKALLKMIKENDSYLTSALYSNILFKNRGYGLISSGNTDTLNKLNIEDLEKRLSVLKKSSHFWLIGGDYKDEDLEKIRNFDLKFNNLAKNDTKEIQMYKPKGYELYFFNKNDKNKITLTMGAPSISLQNENLNSLLIFNKYFGSDFTSVLSQEIREKNGWSYYALSEFLLYKYATSFTLRYAPDIDNLIESFRYLKKLFKKSIKDIDSELLDFTKRKIINSLPFKFSTTLKKLSLLSDLKLYNYKEDFFEKYLEAVEKITPEKLSKDIEKVIFPGDQIVIMTGNLKGKLKQLEESGLFDNIVELENPDFLK